VPLLPGAAPYAADGDGLGILVIHGFAGSPASVTPWAAFLADAGHTVMAPRLPGHGTRWQDLNATTWHSWVREADRTLDHLRRRSDTVVVMGVSSGATIGLRLAELHDDVAGLVAVNPVVQTERRQRHLVPYLARVLPSLPGLTNDIKKPQTDEVGYDRMPLRATHSLMQMWSVVKADIHRVTAPLLILRSADDHVAEPSNATWLLANVASDRVEEILLEDSFHVATLDHDAPRIFEASLAFARSVAA
jgi:carboxylesterase